MQPLIYLASPYTAKHPDGTDDRELMELRFQKVAKYAAHLMRHGIQVFSPIAHTHPILQFGLPVDWAFWKQYDERMLSVCDAMIVLMLDGWEDSKGVNAEIAIMGTAGKPIEWHTPDGRVLIREE